MEALWNDADGLIERAAMVKDGDRCTVVRLAGDLILKRFNAKGRLHTVGHWLLPSRAAWNWRNAERLGTLGIRTPRPQAMLEERWGPLRRRSYLLTARIAARPMLELVPELERPALEALTERFGVIWRRLGAARIGHDDMKATNFLVDDAGEIWLIDLDGMRRHRVGARFRRQRRRDAERFIRNWREHPEAEALFRSQLDRDAGPAAR